MNIKCKDIINAMTELAPEEFAEMWDNVGLLLGSSENSVKKIMVCLDVTKKVTEEAVKEKVDMIVSHHPLFFNPIKKITDDSSMKDMLYTLIGNDICVYCSHTNLDVCKNGLNEFLAKKLGLEDTHCSIDENAEKYVRIGKLKNPQTFNEFIDSVKKYLFVKDLRIIGNVEKNVGNVAVFCGGYDSEICKNTYKEADVLITGDVKYHDALEALEKGFCIIDAGHYATEIIVKELLFEYLSGKFNEIEVVLSLVEENPFRIV